MAASLPQIFPRIFKLRGLTLAEVSSESPGESPHPLGAEEASQALARLRTPRARIPRIVWGLENQERRLWFAHLGAAQQAERCTRSTQVTEAPGSQPRWSSLYLCPGPFSQSTWPLQAFPMNTEDPSAVLFQALDRALFHPLDRRGLRAQEAIRVRSSNQSLPPSPNRPVALPLSFLYHGVLGGWSPCQVGHQDC